jgi:hypothetical protein
MEDKVNCRDENQHRNGAENGEGGVSEFQTLSENCRNEGGGLEDQSKVQGRKNQHRKWR